MIARMKKIKDRLFSPRLPAERSAFLWGPRKTGKTYWTDQTVPSGKTGQD